MAERAGFEPARGKTPDGLANRCLQPLGQRSIGFRFQFNFNFRHPHGWQPCIRPVPTPVVQYFNLRHPLGWQCPNANCGCGLNFNLLHPHGWQLIGIAKLKTPFQFIFNLSGVAPLTGLEPVTFALTGRCSTVELQWSMVML